MKFPRLGKIFSYASVILAGLGSTSSAYQAPAAEAPAKAKKAVELKTDFIRVQRNAKNVYLQTGITRFTKGDVVVDLIGAVHIADKSYYDQLNKEFTQYDALLFEMVGGEGLKQMLKEKAEAQAEAQVPAKKKKDLQMDFISKMHSTMSKKLNLMGQKEGIDYNKENFVHADLTMQEFNDLQKKKKESLLKFAFKNAIESSRQAAQGKGPKQPSTLKLLKALMLGDSNGLKLSIVDTLGTGDDQLGAMMGKDSVIIGDRNAKCLKVMQEQITAGKTNIGIFYGAAHFPDMEDRMIKMGFKQTQHRWLNAWKLDKK